MAPQGMIVEDLQQLLTQALQAHSLGRLPEAAELCQQILQADPNQPRAWHLLGIIAQQAGNSRMACDSIRKAIHLDPEFATACSDLGNVLIQQGELDDALTWYRRAIEISPDFSSAHNNLGNAYQMSNSPQEAIACYRRAIELQPDYAEAYRNLGSALRRTGDLAGALEAFETAAGLNPAFTEALAQMEHHMRHICAWNGLDDLSSRLIEMVESDSGTVNPFLFLCLESTPPQQLLCARQWAAVNLPGPAARPKRNTRRGDRITVGYLSADFQEHATACLISELFSLHDRTRFNILGYSYGRDDGSAARRRLVKSFDRFADLEGASFAAAAGRIQQDGVDILIDLKGYTANARPQILALRPAPVQVSYLGYPGTMGTEAVDYIIVDPFVVPPDQQPHFAEKLIHLPGCYQVNDRTRPISSRIPGRAECGLPPSGFVFCCFSASYKITPKVFDVWMRLLGAAEGSVLWLLESNPLATANLKRAAETWGVAADRLIFAPKAPNPDHLARFAITDLFLDTLPYNAHTVASDALWGGCPVVTCAGKTFESRVAGSLLRAVGLPELVTTSLDEYEALALALARNPEQCRAVREKLREKRLTSALFDSPQFTRHLEDAYEAMWSSQNMSL
jgi:protein O-GlcNAc transferase